jgi:excinuclease ABC subunit A
VPKKRRVPGAWIKIQGAKEHNLRNVDVDFPLGVLACVTGVSGSGKSTLVHDVLFRESAPGERPHAGGASRRLQEAQRRTSRRAGDHGRSVAARPHPALEPGALPRCLRYGPRPFASTSDALAQGFTASSFSFNAGNGRCERCCGNGFEKIEMQFLSDVFVRCPECEGKRYQPHLLEVKLRGQSIHDVLQMTVTRAIQYFSEMGATKIIGPLTVLEEVASAISR